jgi:glycosyltransferase involved in cell wall biosynthesis
MRIAFYSTMYGMSWGGSEELWSRSAAVLLERGRQVSINYRRQKVLPLQLAKLEQHGADVHCRRVLRMGRAMQRALSKLRLGQTPSLRWLKRVRPDFVLVSAGHHLDDLAITQTCRSLGLPYGVLLQAASPYHGIENYRFDAMRAAYAGAQRCFFVSRENQAVIEDHLALDLSDAEIVDNPFQVSTSAAPPWPTSDRIWKLACVARVNFQAKAQDLLLRVLRQPKWRSRPVQVNLWGGDGGSLRHAQQLIALHGQQKQVVIRGFAENIEQLWAEHHALILPSRFEGNPLALIEAMLCGRVPIVTNVGRVSELVDDNRHGFVAAAATAELLDDALERAWQRRHEWQAMGALAAAAIRQRHSLRPAEDFADALLAAATGQQFAGNRLQAA